MALCMDYGRVVERYIDCGLSPQTSVTLSRQISEKHLLYIRVITDLATIVHSRFPGLYGLLRTPLLSRY